MAAGIATAAASAFPYQATTQTALRLFTCKSAIMLRRRFSVLAKAPKWVRPGSHDYLKDIIESRVYDVAVQTPLQHAPSLSSALPGNCSLYLKREVCICSFVPFL